MSFFKKFFAPQHPLDSLRKAVQQRRWADALVEGDFAAGSSLPPGEVEELERLLATAGDALAELNLAEGEAFLRLGDTARAREHFTLAATQARAPGLVNKARELLSPPSVSETIAPPAAAAAAAASCCPSGCGGEAERHIAPVTDDLDAQTHLDLVLGSYPKELAERYAGIRGPFLQAFLLAHEGSFEESLEAFEAVPPQQRNDLFFFERGALLARCGENTAAEADLEQALVLNPHLELAGQTLVNIDLAAGRQAAAEARLRQMLQTGSNVPFALGHLAAILANRGDTAAALEHALRALDCGADAETCILAGHLLENTGRFAEAEACLARLSGAGCGSLNIPLAEFWLRRQQNAEKALQTFKSALRHEPANPRWKLRIGQAYLACGWRREGVALLHQAIEDPQLDRRLREEAAALLAQSH